MENDPTAPTMAIHTRHMQNNSWITDLTAMCVNVPQAFQSVMHGWKLQTSDLMTVEQIHNHSRACCDLQCTGPTKGPYFESLLPSLVSAINPYHRQHPLDRLIPPHKTELYKSSFFFSIHNHSLEQLARKYSTRYPNKWNEKISPKKWQLCTCILLHWRPSPSNYTHKATSLH